jgi:sterol desaturase/sphingolipid hydroxylase (fatty acid hydroxylase superfamily)
VFVAGFLCVAALESWRPKMQLTTRTERRWTVNAITFLLSSIFSAGLLRMNPVFIAIGVSDSRFGVLNQEWLPIVFRFVLAILAIDLGRYVSHVCFHRFHFLCRNHHVNHSDPDFDVATGLRAHPFETVLTQGVTLATIAILAPPISAVVVGELLSCLQSFLTHANLVVPARLEPMLRSVIITSDMHRIHHSANIAEQSRNFGELLPWWDRLFGTYLAEPAAGQDHMIVGLEGVSTRESLRIPILLAHPFRRDPQLQPATLPDES